MQAAEPVLHLIHLTHPRIEVPEEWTSCDKGVNLRQRLIETWKSNHRLDGPSSTSLWRTDLILRKKGGTENGLVTTHYCLHSTGRIAAFPLSQLIFVGPSFPVVTSIVAKQQEQDGQLHHVGSVVCHVGQPSHFVTDQWQISRHMAKMGNDWNHLRF